MPLTSWVGAQLSCGDMLTVPIRGAALPLNMVSQYRQSWRLVLEQACRNVPGISADEAGSGTTRIDW
jgi:hypothetical protein